MRRKLISTVLASAMILSMLPVMHAGATLDTSTTTVTDYFTTSGEDWTTGWTAVDNVTSAYENGALTITSSGAGGNRVTTKNFTNATTQSQVNVEFDLDMRGAFNFGLTNNSGNTVGNIDHNYHALTLTGDSGDLIKFQLFTATGKRSNKQFSVNDTVVSNDTVTGGVIVTDNVDSEKSNSLQHEPLHISAKFDFSNHTYDLTLKASDGAARYKAENIAISDAATSITGLKAQLSRSSMSGTTYTKISNLTITEVEAKSNTVKAVYDLAAECGTTDETHAAESAKWIKDSGNARIGTITVSDSEISFISDKDSRDAMRTINGADSVENSIGEVDAQFNIKMQSGCKSSKRNPQSIFSIRAKNRRELLTIVYNYENNSNHIYVNGEAVEVATTGINERDAGKGNYRAYYTEKLYVDAEFDFDAQKVKVNLYKYADESCTTLKSEPTFSKEMDFMYVITLTNEHNALVAAAEEAAAADPITTMVPDVDENGNTVTDDDGNIVYVEQEIPVEVPEVPDLDIPEVTGISTLYANVHSEGTVYQSKLWLSDMKIYADTAVNPSIISKLENNTVEIYPNESVILATVDNYSTSYEPNDYSGEIGTAVEGANVTYNGASYAVYQNGINYYATIDGKNVQVTYTDGVYAVGVHPDPHVYLTMSDGNTTLSSRGGIAQLEDTYARVNYSEGVTSYTETETVDKDGNVTGTTVTENKTDNVVVLKGLKSGTVTVKIEAENTNNGIATKTKEVTFTIVVKSLDGVDSWTYSNGKDITPKDKTQIFRIDFDNDTTSNYDIFRVYSSSGQAKAAEFYNNKEQVMIMNTAGGVADASTDMGTYKKNNAEATTAVDENGIGSISYSGTPLAAKAKSENSAISGNALFNWVPELKEVSSTGAYLRLKNTNTQRTDKINVEYDFAFYNIIGDSATGVSNAERGTVYGMPQSLSMVSEATQEYGVPYDFVKTSHYTWPEARSTTFSQLSRHILTFFTGRSKGDANGLHAIDMTNTLAYFEPRINKYLDLGIPLKANDYNYFHVSADIDFLNSDIKFTVTNVDTGVTNTIETKIPEYASWSGFITNAVQPSHMITNLEGNTEHKSYNANLYMYLDNIVASKIGEDNSHVTPATVPTAKPIPDGAIINGKNQLNSDNTWTYENRVMNVTPSGIKDGGKAYYEEGIAADGNKYYNFYGENDNGSNGDKVNKSNDTFNYSSAVLEGRGVTQYIDFDFYLPKAGSYITLSPKSYKFPQGNVIIITNAGINSWRTMEYYDKVCGPIETGKWYTMEIVTDNRMRHMDITVKDGDTELGKGRYYMRNIGATSSTGGDYGSDTNRININQNAIQESSGLPAKYFSEASTYLANFRYYEIGTQTEYYPDGYAADINGDVYAEGTEQTASNKANSARIAYYLDNFDQNKVTGTAAEITEGSVPTPPISTKNPKATFKGWKQIYSNDTTRRYKYVAEYEDLDVTAGDKVEDGGFYYQVFNTTITRKSDDWNYDRIKWFVYADNSPETDTSAEDQKNSYMQGVWNISGLPTFSGDGDTDVKFSYCVFKIPVGTNIAAKAQAGYSSYAEDSSLTGENAWIVPDKDKLEQPKPAEKSDDSISGAN